MKTKKLFFLYKQKKLVKTIKGSNGKEELMISFLTFESHLINS